MAKRMTVQESPRTVSLTRIESKFSTMSIQVPTMPSMPDFLTISRPKSAPIWPENETKPPLLGGDNEGNLAEVEDSVRLTSMY